MWERGRRIGTVIRNFALCRSSPGFQISNQVVLPSMSWATFKRLAVVAAITIATAAAASSKENLLRVGTNEPLDVVVHSGLSRDDFVSYPDASYVAVHFSNFSLPEGDLVVVRSPNSEVAHFYKGKGRDNRGDFIASIVPGSTAVVQYFSASGATSSSSPSSPSIAYTISGFSRGFPSKQDESICGKDDSVPAKCFASGNSLFDSLPAAYQKSRSIARLFINAEWLCTGWLAGSEGHLITNHHCITEASEAAVIDIEFDAESASCTDQCKVQFGCAGKIVATTSTLITNNEEFDYALIKLPASADVSAYNYLQLRAAGPALNEQIYIPQHPAGYAKRVSSVIDGGRNATIVSLHAASGCGSNEVFYAADTQGGSSGSPVLAASDNKVVALHHCGFGCDGNTAVDITDVIADLAKKNISVADLIAA